MTRRSPTCRSAAGWPGSCDWPNICAVHSPRPLRQAGAAAGMGTPIRQPPERILRCVGFNAWRLGAPLPQNWHESLSAIWLSPRRARRKVGTRRLSSKPPATCSRYAGATTRGSDGLCGIGFGLGCFTRSQTDRQRPGNQRKLSVQAKHDKTVAANRAANAQSLPKDWDDIDIGHLVLAKAESRWPAWGEAIVVETADDLFKLRWRDNASTPPITRPRFDLALICPDAA